MAEVLVQEAEKRKTLSEFSWENIVEPGAYVDKGTGELYRIPREALVHGSSPLIRKEGMGGSRFAQISKNPFVTSLEARMLCCEHDIQPNF